MSYKKREIGHWNGGKAYKGSRKAKEKEYAKSEIKQAIAEQDDNYLDRHQKSQKRNTQQKLEKKIKWYKAAIERWSGKESDKYIPIWGWGSLVRSCRERLGKLQAKWKGKYGEKK